MISVSSLNNGSGSERHFHCSNTLYSVFAVTDETGTLEERYHYDHYGQRTIYNASSQIISSTVYNIDYAYTGQRLDAETGLMYYKNRYYSLDYGRFISLDPIGYVGWEYQLNLYLYCLDNPQAFIDESGNAPGWVTYPGQPVASVIDLISLYNPKRLKQVDEHQLMVCLLLARFPQESVDPLQI